MTYQIPFMFNRFFFWPRTINIDCITDTGVDINNFLVFGLNHRITEEAWEFQKIFYEGSYDSPIGKNDILLSVHLDLFGVISKYHWYIELVPTKDACCIAVDDITVEDIVYLKLLL